MSKLIRNVVIDGRGFGPGYGNADDVPADVAARITNPAAGDTPPKAHDSDVSAPVAPAEPPPAPTVPEPEPEPQGVPVDILDGLDVDDLRSVADDEGVKVDGRWGEDRLRTEIRDQRAAT